MVRNYSWQRDYFAIVDRSGQERPWRRRRRCCVSFSVAAGATGVSASCGEQLKMSKTKRLEQSTKHHYVCTRTQQARVEVKAEVPDAKAQRDGGVCLPTYRALTLEPPPKQREHNGLSVAPSLRHRGARAPMLWLEARHNRHVIFRGEHGLMFLFERIHAVHISPCLHRVDRPRPPLPFSFPSLLRLHRLPACASVAV